MPSYNRFFYVPKINQLWKMIKGSYKFEIELASFTSYTKWITATNF